MSALLATSDLHCGYGADEIIHAVDLMVAPGEIVTILGPNGCGKTTLVKCILGYVRTSRGRILFEGSEIQALRPTARVSLGIGYVPQLLNTFKPLTIVENLDIGGYRLDSAARAAAKNRMFELFPLLAERRHQKAATLSGGERQLLAMARALMVAPKIIFLDEPSAGLSPLRADEVFRHVGRIAATGVAIVLIEQDVHRALAISERAYVLVTGRIAFSGGAGEIASDDRIRNAYLGGREAPGQTRSHLPSPPA